MKGVVSELDRNREEATAVVHLVWLSLRGGKRGARVGKRDVGSMSA